MAFMNVEQVQRVNDDGSMAMGAKTRQVVVLTVPCTADGQELADFHPALDTGGGGGLVPPHGGFQDYSHVKVKLVRARVTELVFDPTCADYSEKTVVLTPASAIDRFRVIVHGREVVADPDHPTEVILSRAMGDFPTVAFVDFEYVAGIGDLAPKTWFQSQHLVPKTTKWFVQGRVTLTTTPGHPRACCVM